MDALIEVINEILKVSQHPAFIRMLEVAGAIISGFALMHGVKWLFKAFWPLRWNVKLRTMILTILSAYIGYRAGVYFVHGDHAKEWAMFLGLSNPILFFILVQLARVRGWVILLSALKMRPLVEEKGKWKLHETQTFMAKK